MKLWYSQHVFSHPWEKVAFGQMNKYPNPYNTNVCGIDVVDRKVMSDGTLYSHRLQQSEWPMIPSFAISIIGMQRNTLVSEHSWINPKTKSYVMKSNNVDFNSWVSVNEYLEYRPDPSNPNRTILDQRAEINVTGLPLFGSRAESLLVDGFEANCKKGRIAIEWAIDNLKKGYTDLANNISSIASETASGLLPTNTSDLDPSA